MKDNLTHSCSTSWILLSPSFESRGEIGCPVCSSAILFDDWFLRAPGTLTAESNLRSNRTPVTIDGIQ